MFARDGPPLCQTNQATDAIALPWLFDWVQRQQKRRSGGILFVKNAQILFVTSQFVAKFVPRLDNDGKAWHNVLSTDTYFQFYIYNRCIYGKENCLAVAFTESEIRVRRKL